MNEVPNWMIAWWFWLSAIFLVLSILLVVGAAIGLIYVLRLVASLKPKVEALTTDVQGLVQKVDGIAASLKDTVEAVGGRAKGIAGSAEIVAQSASIQFSRFSPVLIAAATGLKLLGMLQERRKPKPEREDPKKKGSVVWSLLKGLLRLVLR